jgi:hypothetical protein
LRAVEWAHAALAGDVCPQAEAVVGVKKSSEEKKARNAGGAAVDGAVRRKDLS